MKLEAIEAVQQIEPNTKIANALKSTRDAIVESSAQMKLDTTIANVAKFAREAVTESSASIKLDSNMADSVKSIKETASKPVVQIGAAFLVATSGAASILGRRKSMDDIVRKVDASSVHAPFSKQTDSRVENDVSFIKENKVVSKNTKDTTVPSEDTDLAEGVALAVAELRTSASRISTSPRTKKRSQFLSFLLERRLLNTPVETMDMRSETVTTKTESSVAEPNVQTAGYRRRQG